MRPRDADSAETVERIVAAATQLLEERGPEGLAIRRVAKLAGVSPGTISYYFSSKGELLEGCFDHYYAGLQRIFEEHVGMLAATGDLHHVIDHGIRQLFRYALRHRSTVRLRKLTFVQGEDSGALRNLRFHFPMLNAISQTVGGAAMSSLGHLRLAAQSMIFVVGSYAVQDDDDLARMVGDESASHEEVIVALEDHLVETAFRLIAPS